MQASRTGPFQLSRTPKVSLVSILLFHSKLNLGYQCDWIDNACNRFLLESKLMAILRNIGTKTIYLERRWRDWFTQVVSCLLLKKPLPVSAPISKNGCKPHPRSTILSQNIPYNATSIHTIPNSAKLEILRSFSKLSCSLYIFQF